MGLLSGVKPSCPDWPLAWGHCPPFLQHKVLSRNSREVLNALETRGGRTDRMGEKQVRKNLPQGMETPLFTPILCIHGHWAFKISNIRDMKLIKIAVNVP